MRKFMGGFPAGGGHRLPSRTDGAGEHLPERRALRALRMKKAKTERKLDEIVAFAEMENFMDTPLKYYCGIEEKNG